MMALVTDLHQQNPESSDSLNVSSGETPLCNKGGEQRFGLCLLTIPIWLSGFKREFLLRAFHIMDLMCISPPAPGAEKERSTSFV